MHCVIEVLDLPQVKRERVESEGRLVLKEIRLVVRPLVTKWIVQITE